MGGGAVSGGGGAMLRSAAKAAALARYRSIPAGHASAAAASVNFPSAPAPASGVSATQKGLELVGGKEDESLDVLHPPPRLVFGPVPTFDEAKEAASDLNVALDMLYFPSTKSHFEESKWDPKDGSSQSKTSETSVMDALGTNGLGTVLPSGKGHVLHAFSLLKEPEVQTVVASLASDKNVWDAVMLNPKVQEFYNSHQQQIATEYIRYDASQMEDSTISEYSQEDDSETLTEATSNVKTGFLNTLKSRALKLVDNLTDLMQNLFGTPKTTEEPLNGASQTKSADQDSYFAGAASTFVALAVAVVLMILFKRA